MPSASPRAATPPDRFRLYEIAVTNAPLLARFACALHPSTPVLLREDFSGTAALARAFLKRSSAHRAIAVDRDPDVTRRIPRQSRLRILTQDVLATSPRLPQSDLIAATNFAVGYFHERADLLRYLRLCRERLAPSGVFFCDLYGGTTALSTGRWSRTIPLSRGSSFTYTWRQLAADPLRNLVHNAIDFSARAPHPWRITSAFTYHWRLWSIPELTDAMRDAGFTHVEVHDRLGDAIDSDGRLYLRPVAPDHEWDDPFVAYVAARVPSPKKAAGPRGYRRPAYGAAGR